MLLVGITGGPGSGKSTAAGFFRELGAHVTSSDETARALMQPGETVYAEIVRAFGSSVVAPDGKLDRSALGRLAFSEGRLQELEQLVHPAVLAAEKAWAERLPSDSIGMVEAAIFFERLLPPGIDRSSPSPEVLQSVAKQVHQRFHRVVLVTAPDEQKIERFARRMLSSHADSSESAARADAARRLALQIPDAVKAPYCDEILPNDSTPEVLRTRVHALWQKLQS
ncbi:dephospho-CoA kinase [Terriglobus saanensis]|uniref:Dephospho-CoA kinase n=1 Tax=Terriglobus saanensis (strain ATCC BAA-1853 / DSM 23119 / SP1PR4) TaxID=401053 RepID=E8V362_TERSS|nr:dephospho-CoA kinase [Terriglobus saanensis]ADV81337.1 dephospho-CoA kinase [Terriglobus saanensis SP1PR4]